MQKKTRILFNLITNFKEKAPWGLFSYIKYFIIIYFFFPYLNGDNVQKFGFFLYNSNKWEHSVIKSLKNDFYNNGLYSMVELKLGSISMLNSMFVTTDSLESIKGGSRNIGGVYGYTNRAFMKMSVKTNNVNHNLLFGREYFSVGYGKMDKLFIGNSSRPFDQFLWEYKYKDIFGSSGFIQLENINKNKRYLTFHTFGFSNSKFSFTLAEAILYTGQDRSLELQYINPVLTWIPEMHNNTTGEGNGFIYAGIKYFYSVYISFWSEILIDDYQLLFKGQEGSGEPNALGLMLGSEVEGWPFLSSSIILEYTCVNNRTYQTQTPEEIYTHRGFPIGHYLGNDFDLLQFSFSNLLIKNKLKPYISLGYLRDGANGFQTPFDTVWEDSEPFPTEPITYIAETEFGLEVTLFEKLWMSLGAFYQNQNFNSKSSSTLSYLFRIRFSMNKIFEY